MMRRSTRVCFAVATILVATSAAFAQDSSNNEDALIEDLAKIQGTWGSTGPRKAGPGRQDISRIVKNVKGNRSIVTYYDKEGKVLRSHTSEFKLEVKDRVRIFTFSNLEVTEGPQKGQKSQEGWSFSYIYTVDNDTWVEARGLLVDQRDGQPRLLVWKRVSDEASAAK